MRKRGDELRQFSEVYEQYSAPVHRFLLSLTRDETMAEELTQETLYRAFLHIDRFRGQASLYGWLCQIAKNLYFNEYRKNKRHANMPAWDETEAGGDFTFRILQKEQAIMVHRILHALPEPYKEVFTLKVFGELTFREIAGLFGKTESWAKMTFYRAKERIATKMEERE
ncbi:RNA polymerase sigma factor [Paenibacillus sp. 1011MAR3C5]|uniref:RNA polymerase sigma factor n=1 Tax=Paenibacillus sp. 1011MAR3C5 TaxID=1675787 RepID=UPI000E6C3DFD|nr:RNA polymerase sigma factor [Paenibacillus sp. 1011MAR3C5]RJE85180.1 RNA polymerase sigma factor [Paenibacillus sp. 1011MAR3C5]